MGNGIPHAESETFHAKDMGISREVRATSVISALNDDIGNLCKDDSDNSPGNDAIENKVPGDILKLTAFPNMRLI